MRIRKLRCQPCGMATYLRSKCTLGFHISEPYAKIHTSSASAGRDFAVSTRELDTVRRPEVRQGLKVNEVLARVDCISCKHWCRRVRFSRTPCPRAVCLACKPLYARTPKAWRQYDRPTLFDKCSYGRRFGDTRATKSANSMTTQRVVLEGGFKGEAQHRA